VPPDELREAQALARNDRFLLEVVEGWSLCPYARGTRLSGQLAREVLLDAPTPAEVAARATTHEGGTASIVLLIFPDLLVDDARAFERFADECRKHASRCFAFAPFHPDTSFSNDTPSRLVGLFRRTPDPTLQLVRFAALDAARKRAPDGKFYFDGSSAAWDALSSRPERGLSEQIAHDNWSRAKDRTDELAGVLSGLRTAR
jgi:hypothetical protein